MGTSFSLLSGLTPLPPPLAGVPEGVEQGGTQLLSPPPPSGGRVPEGVEQGGPSGGRVPEEGGAGGTHGRVRRRVEQGGGILEQKAAWSREGDRASGPIFDPF